MREKLRTWFNSGDWYFSENTHRIEILYGPNGQEINVSFQEVKYDSKRNKDIETYHIVFESPFFGYKANDERAHQELYEKTMQKIPWRKKGFWLEDGSLIPQTRVKVLRMK